VNRPVSFIFVALVLTTFSARGQIRSGSIVGAVADKSGSAVASADLPMPAISPVTGGGLGIAWMLEPRRLEIEVLPDGSLEYFTVERMAGEEQVTEGTLPRERLGETPGLMRPLIDWLLHG